MLAAVLLALAIVLEVASSALLPRAQGFTHAGWTAVVLAGYVTAIWLLTVVVKTVPVSVAYAIWAGAGTALVAMVGWAFLGEPLGWLQAASIALIVAGVIGLNVAGTH